jgi:hypothetical protein
MIGIILWVIDIRMMLQMHSREHGEGKAQHQRTSMSHQGIHNPISMGCIMTGIVNHRPCHVYGEDIHTKAAPVRPVPKPVTAVGDYEQGDRR